MSRVISPVEPRVKRIKQSCRLPHERSVVHCRLRPRVHTATIRAPFRPRTLALPDGGKIRLRPIKPSDDQLLVEAFERLGPESRYRRFLGPMPRLPADVVEYLTTVDNDRHQALIAVDLETGQMVGVARYFRDHDDPG